MPANNSYATAMDITTLPFSISQDPGGVFDELWYKYTGQAGDVAIGLFVENATWSAGHYLPQVTTYTAGPVVYLGGLNQNDGAVQVPSAPGLTLYFQVTNIVGTYTAGDLISVSLIKPNYNAISSGDIFINDDTNGFPAEIFNSGGQVTFVNTVAGERGAVLLDGTIALQDRSDAGFNPPGTGVFGSNVKIYNNTLGFITDVPGVIADTDVWEPVILDDRTTQFYVIQNTNVATSIMRSVSKTGVVGGTTWNIPIGSNGVAAAGIDISAGILYLQSNAINSPIKRFNLASSTFLSDLAAGPGINWEPGKEILIMSDGSIVAKYFNESVAPWESRIYHYEPTGVLRYMNAYADGIQFVNRLAYDRDSTTNYKVWFYISLDLSGIFSSFISSRFKSILALNGAESNIFNIQNYEVGISTGTTYWDGVRFGPSTSCPFLILVVAIPPAPPNPGSGIYKLVPLKRQDTIYNDDLTSTFDTKIP